MKEKKFPCKSCIKVTKGGCCNQLPVFNLEELSRVIFKHEDIIAEKKLSPRKWEESGMYVLVPRLPEETLKAGIALTDYTCPFLDMENARCLIYENRPLICSAYGESIGTCPYEGQDEVREEEKTKILQSFDKSFSVKQLMPVVSHYRKSKPLKELPIKKALKMVTAKEFKHLLVAFNEFVDILRNTDYFQKDYKYGFVQKLNGDFSPYEMLLLKAEHPFSALQKPYNFLQRKLMLIDYDILSGISTKINNVFKNVTLNENRDKKPSIEKRLLFSVEYLEYFKDYYKNKSKEYTGLINAEELYLLKKELFRRLGYDNLFEGYQSKEISDVIKTVEIIYKGINQLK